MDKISVIGLGKLGAPLLATVAARGFQVIGVDVNRPVVEKVNKGVAPVAEPKLSSLLKKYKRRIKATTSYQEAILGSNITFIIVPTPSLKNGNFSNKYVLAAAGKIGQALAKKGQHHLICVTSTVLPHSMDKEIVPTLEKYSGKRAGEDFGVCYNPEFIALGSVTRDLLNPDFVLIGESDKKAGDMLANFYKKFCKNKPAIARMNFINAEIAKIALNSYITTKISFANTLAQIAEKVPGGNVDQITKAIGQDSRIGIKYLKGALPYGGPCFPRDNRAFSHFAKKLKVKTPIAKAADLVNENLARKLAKETLKLASSKSKVSILGLAYKPETDVAEESAGVKLANYLSKKIKVFAWDPKANENAKEYLSNKVILADSLKDCLAKANIIVVTTPWNQFKNLSLPIPPNPHRPILIDCWRILDPVKYQKVAKYRTIGIAGLSLQ